MTNPDVPKKPTLLSSVCITTVILDEIVVFVVMLHPGYDGRRSLDVVHLMRSVVYFDNVSRSLSLVRAATSLKNTKTTGVIKKTSHIAVMQKLCNQNNNTRLIDFKTSCIALMNVDPALDIPKAPFILR